MRPGIAKVDQKAVGKRAGEMPIEVRYYGRTELSGGMASRATLGTVLRVVSGGWYEHGTMHDADLATLGCRKAALGHRRHYRHLLDFYIRAFRLIHAAYPYAALRWSIIQAVVCATATVATLCRHR
jgi:hypothetical protein